MPAFVQCFHTFSFKPLSSFETNRVGYLLKMKHVLDCVAGLEQGHDSVSVRS